MNQCIRLLFIYVPAVSMGIFIEVCTDNNMPQLSITLAAILIGLGYMVTEPDTISRKVPEYESMDIALEDMTKEELIQAKKKCLVLLDWARDDTEFRLVSESLNKARKDLERIDTLLLLHT